MKRLGGTAVLAAALTISLTACGSSSGGSASSPDNVPRTVATTSATTTPTTDAPASVPVVSPSATAVPGKDAAAREACDAAERALNAFDAGSPTDATLLGNSALIYATGLAKGLGSRNVEVSQLAVSQFSVNGVQASDGANAYAAVLAGFPEDARAMRALCDRL